MPTNIPPEFTSFPFQLLYGNAAVPTQSIYKEYGGAYEYLLTLKKQDSVALLVASPVALMTYSTNDGTPYYVEATLDDYYNNSSALNWTTPSGLFSGVTNIIYCPATNDNSPFGGGIFIALAQGQLYYSSDDTGSQFSYIYGCPIAPIDMAFADGILVVVDSSSAVFTVDLKNWITLQPIVPPPRLIASIK